MGGRNIVPYLGNIHHLGPLLGHEEPEQEATHPQSGGKVGFLILAVFIPVWAAWIVFHDPAIKLDRILLKTLDLL